MGKESTCKAGHTGDSGLIPGLWRSPGEGNSSPLQCSCLNNPMDRGAWWATVPRITEASDTPGRLRTPRKMRACLWLSGKEFGCQCRRCRFDPAVRKSSWRRKRQPTPVFLPGKSHGWRSLACYNPWGCKELDTTYLLNNNNRKINPSELWILVASTASEIVTDRGTSPTLFLCCYPLYNPHNHLLPMARLLVIINSKDTCPQQTTGESFKPKRKKSLWGYG